MTTEQVRPDVAVFIDFENVYVSVHEKLDASPNFESIMDRCNDIGRVVIARAYADWYRYPRITSALYANGIEPIYVPTYYYDKDMGRTGRAIKNSVDMNLCIDAMKSLFINANVEKFVLITGDRDFIPLVNSIRQQGKEVFIIGIGGAASTHLAQSADEFIFYEQLVGKTPPPAARRSRASRSEPEPGGASRPSAPVETDIYDTLVEAVHLVRERGYLSTLGSLKLVMKELMGGDFKESRYKDPNGRAFTKFKDFVVEAERRGKVQIYTNGTVSEVFLPGEDASKLSQFAEIKGEENQTSPPEPSVQSNGARDQEKPAASSPSSSSSSRSRRRRRPRNQRQEAPPSPAAETSAAGSEERGVPDTSSREREPSRRRAFAETPGPNGEWDFVAREPLFLLEDGEAAASFSALAGASPGEQPGDDLGMGKEGDILAREPLLFLEDDDTLLFEAEEFFRQPSDREREDHAAEKHQLPFLEDQDKDFLFNVGEALTLSQMIDARMGQGSAEAWFEETRSASEEAAPDRQEQETREPAASPPAPQAESPVGEAPDAPLMTFLQPHGADRPDSPPEPSETPSGDRVARGPEQEPAEPPPPVEPSDEAAEPPEATEPEIDTVFSEEEWQAFRTMMQGFSKPASFAQIFDSLRTLRKEQVIIRTNEQLRNFVKQAISNGLLERSGRGKRVYYTLKQDEQDEQDERPAEEG